MAKRATWDFEFSAAVLLGAAEEKNAYHTGRWTHWQAELLAAEKDLRENGIDMRAAVQMGQTGSNAYHSEPVVDNQKVRRIQECNQKLAEHQELTEDYARFMRAFEREAPDRMFPCQSDDLKYFGL